MNNKNGQFQRVVSNDQAFHVVGRVRARSPLEFNDAPWLCTIALKRLQLFRCQGVGVAEKLQNTSFKSRSKKKQKNS